MSHLDPIAYTYEADHHENAVKGRSMSKVKQTVPTYAGQPVYRVGDRVGRASGGPDGPIGRVLAVIGPYEVRVLWNGRKERVYRTGEIVPA